MRFCFSHNFALICEFRVSLLSIINPSGRNVSLMGTHNFPISNHMAGLQIYGIFNLHVILKRLRVMHVVNSSKLHRTYWDDPMKYWLYSTVNSVRWYYYIYIPLKFGFYLDRIDQGFIHFFLFFFFFRLLRTMDSLMGTLKFRICIQRILNDM